MHFYYTSMAIIKYKNWKTKGLSGLWTMVGISWNRNRTETPSVSRAQSGWEQSLKVSHEIQGTRASLTFWSQDCDGASLLCSSWEKMRKVSCRPITWSSGGKRPKYRSEHQEPIQPPDDLARESVLCSVSLWEDTQIPFQQPFLDWQAWYVNMQAIAKFKNWELWLRGRKRGGIRKRTMEK